MTPTETKIAALNQRADALRTELAQIEADQILLRHQYEKQRNHLRAAQKEREERLASVTGAIEVLGDYVDAEKAKENN